MVSKELLPSPLLKLHNLGCARDNRCLFAGIHYDVNAGDIVHIEGPNGTGKTTLLRALIGLFPEYQGEIFWQGESITQQYYDFYSQLLFIGHLTGIKKTLTPRENLRFLSTLNNPSVSLDKINQALEAVGLYGYEDMPGYQLSAGQQRRIALARLYLTDATLWVLDEPYTALDAAGIGKLESLFEAHAKQGGCVILTSHQPPTIKQLRHLLLLDYPANNNDLFLQEGLI